MFVPIENIIRNTADNACLITCLDRPQAIPEEDSQHQLQQRAAVHRSLVAIDYRRSAQELYATEGRTVDCHAIHYNRRSARPAVDVAAQSPWGCCKLNSSASLRAEWPAVKCTKIEKS